MVQMLSGFSICWYTLRSKVGFKADSKPLQQLLTFILGLTPIASSCSPKSLLVVARWGGGCDGSSVQVNIFHQTCRAPVCNKG
jgi:hypothetical protein